MITLVTLLSLGGMLAGLIHYFVDFKKLPIDPPEVPKLADDPGFLARLYLFLRKNWELFAYLIIGISGALLLPLAFEFSGRNMPGLEKIRLFLEASKPGAKPSPLPLAEIPFNPWLKMVLLGYGIIFGYIALQLLKKIGDILLGQLGKLAQRLQKLEREVQASTVLQDRGQLAPLASLPVQRAGFTDDSEAFAEWLELNGFAACARNPNPIPWRARRVAKCVCHFRDQVDRLAPTRDRTLDGTVGDEAHEKRESDHNAWVWNAAEQKGIVTAIDVTHDAVHCDCSKIALSLQQAKDERIKYVIWNAQIMSSYPVGGIPAWTWRTYSQPNPHDKHIHISVACSLGLYDSTADWNVAII
jgi:hypothetical protein